MDAVQPAQSMTADTLMFSSQTPQETNGQYQRTSQSLKQLSSEKHFNPNQFPSLSQGRLYHCNSRESRKWENGTAVEKLVLP